MNDETLMNVGGKIRQWRKEAGWSGRKLARLSMVTQPTLSRVENGQRVRSPDVVSQIISALPLEHEQAARLRSEVRAAYSVTAERRVDAGVSLKPDIARRLERLTSSISGFQSAVVPRLLRTAAYAKAAGTRDLGVSGVLDDESRSFRFVVTEGALRTWPGSESVMPAQLDHLVAVSERVNVWLGVVPWSVPLGVVPPHGFTLYGDDAVSVETFTAEVTITNPDDVAAYQDVFAVVERAAVVGDEARALLAAVRDDFRKLIH